MGSITQRKNKTGVVRYRAVIRIRKAGADYTESRTFSKKSLADSWLKKRESEIEINPTSASSIKQKASDLTLGNAIHDYISEVKDFGRSKLSTLNLIKRLPIAHKKITELMRQDFAQHVQARRNGDLADYGLKAAGQSTVKMDLQYIKTILQHAELVWGIAVNITELDAAMRGLSKARMIGKSSQRYRLPTSGELQRLTTLAYNRFAYTSLSDTPIHLVMWFAIYSARRLTELTRLRIENYDREHGRWLLESVKHPDGSEGNDKFFVVDERLEPIIDLFLEPKLRKRMLKRGGNSDYLIPVTRESIDRQFQEIKRQAGIVDLHFHDFRHEAATRLAESGKSIPQIQQYTLHSSWDSLKIYVNLQTIRKNVLEFDAAMQAAQAILD